MQDMIYEPIDQGRNQETAASDEQARSPEIAGFAQGEELAKDKKKLPIK